MVPIQTTRLRPKVSEGSITIMENKAWGEKHTFRPNRTTPIRMPLRVGITLVQARLLRKALLWWILRSIPTQTAVVVRIRSRKVRGQVQGSYQREWGILYKLGEKGGLLSCQSTLMDRETREGEGKGFELGYV